LVELEYLTLKVRIGLEFPKGA